MPPTTLNSEEPEIGGGSRPPARLHALNESPSEKEGKFKGRTVPDLVAAKPSMKVPPKRKGNAIRAARLHVPSLPSMKVPPKRKGN